MTYRRVCIKSTMAGATSGAGTSGCGPACVSNVRVIELSEKWGYYDG